jgi:hypothetical protein
VQANPKSAVLLQFRNKKIVALIDSGSAKSIVSEKFVHKFGLQILPLTTGDVRVPKAANGNPLHVLGKIEIDIKINGLITPYEFYVLSDISHDLILGFNYLIDNKCQIDFTEKKVTFYDGLTALQLLSEGNDYGVVRLSKSCTIKPGFESIQPAILSKKFDA